MNKYGFMKQAIALAEKGRGRTSPNPFVGALIVKNDRIVGKGFTQPAGQNHAEVEAILDAGDLCNGADIYVTLEPCCHFGKTPPCTNAIISNGIKKVFVGILDPDNRVAGKGVSQLLNAGLDVETGICEDIINKQLESYIFSKQNSGLFVHTKIAASLDGKTALENGESKWITNELSRARVHEMRNRSDVVITGINTVLTDNPMLNVRGINDSVNPVRVILDTNLRIPLDCEIVKTADNHRTIVFHVKDEIDKVKELEIRGIKCVKVAEYSSHVNLDEVIDYLKAKGYMILMLEAGRILNTAFLEKGLINKISYFIGSKILGGDHSIFHGFKLDSMDKAIELKTGEVIRCGDDLLVEYYIQ